MDGWMNSATKEQDWAFPNSPERGSSPVLQACVPIKAERQHLLLPHFIPWKMPFNPLLPWVTWWHNSLWCRVGVSCPLSHPDHCSHHRVTPEADFGSHWCPFSSQLLEDGGMSRTFTSLSYHRDEHLPDVCLGCVRCKCQPCS